MPIIQHDIDTCELMFSLKRDLIRYWRWYFYNTTVIAIGFDKDDKSIALFLFDPDVTIPNFLYNLTHEHILLNELTCDQFELHKLYINNPFIISSWIIP